MVERPKTRTSKKKGQIVEAATALFTRFGARRVTVEEICRKAGASKMTFYKYFPNKMELLKYIWNSWIDEGFGKLEEIDAMDIPFLEKLQKLIEYKMESLSKMSPEFIDEFITTDPEMKEFVDQMRTKSISRFMEYVSDAQEKGNMRQMRPELFLALIEKLKEIVQDEHLRKVYPNDVEFIREIHNFLFFGVLPMERRESQ